MDDSFKIFIDRLEKGGVETIQKTVSSEFMEIHESDVFFKKPIEISGKAFLTQDTLVIHLHLRTSVTMLCAICNVETEVPLEIQDGCCTAFSEEFANGIFDYQDFVRESLLLELPLVVECNQGSCKERQNLAKYLKKNQGERVESPFADL